MKIDFEFDTSYGVFRDALHLLDDHTFTEEEIQAMKQQRLDNWMSIVNPPEGFIPDVPDEEIPPIEEV
jgi:hypothetical protein